MRAGLWSVTVFSALILASRTGFSVAKYLPGGASPILSWDDAMVKRAAAVAVDQYNRRTNSMVLHVASRLVGGTKQVVAGIKYRLQMEVAPTNCFNPYAVAQEEDKAKEHEHRSIKHPGKPDEVADEELQAFLEGKGLGQKGEDCAVRDGEPGKSLHVVVWMKPTPDEHGNRYSVAFPRAAFEKERLLVEKSDLAEEV